MKFKANEKKAQNLSSRSNDRAEKNLKKSFNKQKAGNAVLE